MTTWITTIAAGAIGIALLTLGTLLWVRLIGYRGAPPRVAETSSKFTSTHFDPMARLLGDEDLDFLHQFEKCRPRLATRWERDRRRIFRLYLREATADFQQMHAEARQVVARAPEQHADLVGLLMRQQATFWRTLAVIELRLALSGLGIGKLDGARIATLVDAMRMEVNRRIALSAA